MSLRSRFRSRLEQRWADRIEEIASEEISAGATAADIKPRVEARLQQETGSRPFLDFLMKLFEQLLPLLLQLLTGAIVGGLEAENKEERRQ